MRRVVAVPLFLQIVRLNALRYGLHVHVPVSNVSLELLVCRPLILDVHDPRLSQLRRVARSVASGAYRLWEVSLRHQPFPPLAFELVVLPLAFVLSVVESVLVQQQVRFMLSLWKKI